MDKHICDYCGKTIEDNMRMTIEYLDKYKEKDIFSAMFHWLLNTIILLLRTKWKETGGYVFDV